MKPRSRGRGRSAVVALAISAVLATGCGITDAEPNQTASTCPAAALETELVELGVGLGVRDGERLLEVDWPDDWAVVPHAGRLSLVDPAGRVVAGSGDRVLIAGGEVRPGTWLACDPPVLAVIEPG